MLCDIPARLRLPGARISGDILGGMSRPEVELRPDSGNPPSVGRLCERDSLSYISGLIGNNHLNRVMIRNSRRMQ